MNNILKLNIILAILALISISTTGISPAKADTSGKEIKSYAKPMPDIALMDKAEFEESSVVYQEKPFDDMVLSYVLRLPKTWKQSEGKVISSDFTGLSTKIFGEVGRYYGPVSIESGFPSRLTIDAIGLDYEMTAEQWFMQHLLQNGYALQGMAVHSEDRAEALFVVIENDVSYAVRAVAVRNATRIVLAQYAMPMDLWAQDKHLQARVIADFKLVNPKDELVEEMEEYYFLDIAKMQYPESWELRSPPLRGVDEMNIRLLSIPPKPEGHRGDTVTLNGRIEVTLISVYATDSLEEEVNKFRKTLEDTGLIFTEELDVPEEYDFNKDFEFATVEAFKVSDKESKLLDYEHWLSIMSAGEYYYFVSLLSPSREDDFYVWARNTQTYKLVLEHIEPQLNTLTTQ